MKEPIERRLEIAPWGPPGMFRSISDLATEGMYIKDLDLRYAEANPAMARLFELPVEGILGRTDTEILGAEKGRYTRRLEARVLQGEAIEAELDVTLGGRAITVLLREAPLRDTEGRIVGLCGVASDVGALRRITDGFRRTEERLRTIFEYAPDTYFLCDPDGRLLDGNRAAEEMIGYSRDELIGESLLRPSLLSRDQIPRAARTLLMGSLGHPTGPENFTLKRRDGTQVTAEIRTYPVKIAGRDVILGIARDVTERIRSGRERTRLAAAVEQTTEGIVITTPAGVIEYANPAFCSATGYEPGEVLGMDIAFAGEAAGEDPDTRGLREALRRGEAWAGRLVTQCKDARRLIEDVSLSPVLDERGEVVHFVAVRRDVTSEIELRQQLCDAQKSEAIATLAEGIAHDFSNILYGILGYANLASKQAPPDSEQADYAGEIIQGVRRAEDLLAQIRAVGRPEKARRSRLALQPLIVEVLRFLRPSIPASIEVRIAIDAECADVWADASQMYQVLLNLCTNALQAMAEGGGQMGVELSSARRTSEDAAVACKLAPGGYAILTVTDTGPGMTREMLERVFEPYFTTRAGRNGTGLGLSIVDSLLREHGGSISATSDLGRGTRFDVLLPLYDPAAREMRENEDRCGGSDVDERVGAGPRPARSNKE